MYTPDNYPFVFKPFDYQFDVISSTWDKKSWAYFMEMGTGKSKILIDVCGLLFSSGKIDTVVVIAKKGEYANWAHTQFPEHMPECINHDVYLYSGARYKTKSGKSEFERFRYKDNEVNPRLKCFVINIEALTTKDGADAMAAVYRQSQSGVMLGVDESTCAKNISAKRSKEVYRWAAKSHYRRIMTGTPITQSPMDLWGQCLILGKDKLGFKSFYAFRGRYAVMETKHFGQRAIQVIKDYVNLDELSQLLSTFSTVLTKAECLDLPEKIYTKISVPLSRPQQLLYDQMRDEAMLEIEGTEMEVTNVISMIVKLHQISCGQLKIDENSYMSIENDRFDAMMSVIEDYPGKAIIWANYRQTLRNVMSGLIDEYGEKSVGGYYGGVPDNVRADVIKRFQDPDDPMRFFVSNPQSGGYGLTLTQAQLVIYYSNSYNLEHRLQSEDRAHRIGQTNKVTYVDLFSPDTVDVRILEVLRNKKSLADMVMNAPSLRELLWE